MQTRVLKKRNGGGRTDSSGNDDWSESGASEIRESVLIVQSHCLALCLPMMAIHLVRCALLFLSSSFFSVEFASLVVVNLYIYCLSPSVSFVYFSSEAWRTARWPVRGILYYENESSFCTRRMSYKKRCKILTLGFIS